MIARIGQALYGPHYTTPMADALGVSRRSVQSWASGRDPVPPGVWRELFGLLVRRLDECEDLLTLLVQSGLVKILKGESGDWRGIEFSS